MTKQYSKAEIQAIKPDSEGLRHFPGGHYNNYTFEGKCSFSEKTKFGGKTKFIGESKFQEGCEFEAGCTFGPMTEIIG